MEKLIFPNLYCPFPSEMNKHFDVLEDYEIEWVLRFNLLKDESDYQRFRKSKFWLLTAMVYPDCQFEELKIANNWICWLFFWDDECDMTFIGKKPEILEAFQNRFLAILQGSEITNEDTPLAHALFDIRKRMLKIESPKLFNNFVHAVEKYFAGSLLEAKNRLHGIVPKLDTCANIHLLSGAVDSVLELIEICNHLHLPKFLKNQGILPKLKIMSNNIMCWTNDIFSSSRELESGDVHNVVLALHFHQHLSLQKAMQVVADMHNQEVEEMLKLEASLPYFGERLEPVVRKYISGLHTWICGNYYWSARSSRYQTVERLAVMTKLPA